MANVDSIKKGKMPQIDPATLPGYFPPPELAASARQVVPALARPPGPQAAQEMGYDLRPAPAPPPAQSVWLSRHFKTERSEDIGAWLTEIERAGGVQGIASAYSPGGVVVIVKTREVGG